MALKAPYPWEPYDPSAYDLRYLSLGAGVQSSTLLALSALGLYGVPRVDVAIFADTQDEPKWVYEHLWQLAEWADTKGVRVDIVTAGRLSECKWVYIPSYTLSDGKPSITKRQCTHKYKIVPIVRRARQLLGINPRERKIKTMGLSVQGISYDELTRMKDSREKFIHIEYPLIRLGWTRHHCEEWWKANMPMPLPRKSACVYCPFRSNAEWRDIKEDSDAWALAVQYDSHIRSEKSPLRKPTYLHRSLKPISDVDFSVDDADQSRFNFVNECEGMCGV